MQTPTKNTGREERSAANQEAREHGMNYGRYVGLQMMTGLSVQQTLECKRESGTYTHEKYSDRLKRLEQEKMEKEGVNNS